MLLLLIDYERGRRLKLWGRARVVDGDPALLSRVADAAILFDVMAWDLNCRQHVPRLLRVRGATAPLSDAEA